MTALTDYPEIFIGSGATTSPFTRAGGPRVAHYTATMGDQTVTQYQAMLNRAEIRELVPLRFVWRIQNQRLIDGLLEKAAGRPLIVVHGGRTPMQRTDSFSVDLMPKAAGFNAALAALGDCYRVRVGNARHMYSLPVDLDLGASTSVTDLLDIGWACAGVVAQCSFAVPLAEAFDKPLLGIWAANGLRSEVGYIRTITPRKILTKPTSRYVIDDWPAGKIMEVARAFRAVG